MTAKLVSEHCCDISRALAEEEATLKEVSQHSLKVSLGELLCSGKAGTLTCISKPLTKMEFRLQVRKFLKEPEAKDIDALFLELDTDGGGSLDGAEIKAAMKKLPALFHANEAAKANLREKIDSLRSRLAQAQAVVDATQAAESTQERLEALREKRSIRARVGALLAARNTKIADLINSWETTKGECTKAQFRRNLGKLGLNAEAEASDIDGLFDELDADCGGTLDIDELKLALSVLQEAAKAADKELARLRKSSVDMWREARAAQADEKQRRKEEAAERERAEAEAMAEAVRKAEAEEAAKARKAEAVAEARKRKAEEQAIFDAKIAARRSAVALAGAPGAVPLCW